MAFLSTQEYRQLRHAPLAGHLPKVIADLVTGYLVAPGVEALVDGLMDRMIHVLAGTIRQPYLSTRECKRMYHTQMTDQLPKELVDLMTDYSDDDCLPGRSIMCNIIGVSPDAPTNIRAIEERGDGLWTKDQIFVKVHTSATDLWGFICGDDSIYGPALEHALAYISGPPYPVTSKVLLGTRDMLREHVRRYRPGL